MSAICGLFFRQEQALDLPLFQLMLERLNHRGLDGSELWYNGSIGFGIQKLFNTPESLNEKLPFYDSQQKLAIVADARLDNRDELFKLLSIDSTMWRLSDSQLILHAYQKWGLDCAYSLIGDFVAAIWDEKNKRLVILTDPCGLRSVYYYIDEKIFAFASEVKSLLSIPEIPCKPNLSKIAKLDYLSISDESNEETYFDSIYALPSATVYSVTSRQVKKTQYWQPDINKRLIFNSEDDYIESFQSLFSSAIKNRLRSAYPVGSLLSGGLDSSAVTAMAASLLAKKGDRLRTYSVVKAPEYAADCIDEREYIDCFRDVPNLDRHYLMDGWRGPFDDLEQLILAGESPIYSSRHFLFSAYASRMKEEGVRTLLNGRYGEAGPSCSGAGYLAELVLRGRIGSMMDEIRKIAQLRNRTYLSVFKHEVLKPLLPLWLLKPRHDLRLKQETSILKPEFIREQLGEKHREYALSAFDIGHIRANHRGNQYKNLMGFIQEQKIKLKFVGYESIQRVYPYLDKPLIEFCLAIPGDMKVKNGYHRYLVRSGMRGLMPEGICKRISSAPFSPDYHFRYNKQRVLALDSIESRPRGTLIDDIIDINKLKNYLKTDMKTNKSLSNQGFKAMISVPQGIYLLQFLKQFFV